MLEFSPRCCLLIYEGQPSSALPLFSSSLLNDLQQSDCAALGKADAIYCREPRDTEDPFSDNVLGSRIKTGNILGAQARRGCRGKTNVGQAGSSARETFVFFTEEEDAVQDRPWKGLQGRKGVGFLHLPIQDSTCVVMCSPPPVPLFFAVFCCNPHQQSRRRVMQRWF